MKSAGIRSHEFSQRQEAKMRTAAVSAIMKYYITQEGEAPTAEEAKDIASRVSLIGYSDRVAKAVRSEKYYCDKRGCWHAKGIIGGVRESTVNRALGQYRYWATVRLIRDANKISTVEAREAYAADREAWEEIMGYEYEEENDG